MWLEMLDWDAEWKAAHERSPLKVTPENEGRWRDFWSLDAQYYLNEVKAESAFYDLVVGRLMDEGWARPEDDVLDIGSGPGTLALPLSAKVRSVTALDEAEGMLDVLRRESCARGASNIIVQKASWQEHHRREGFDLVLTSLSPAVRCGEDLFAMEEASRDRCCLMAPCPSDCMATRNALWEKVVGKFVPSDAYSTRYPLNLLLDRGRVPELFRVKARTRTEVPVEMEIEHFLRYFSIFTEMDDEKVEKVREHVLSRSHEGKSVRDGDKCLHLICWNKHR